MNSATEEFRRISAQAIDCLLAQDPVGATWLGDHRFDSLLPDLSIHAMQRHAHEIEDLLTALDAVDDLELESHDFVDLEILRDQLLKAHFDLTEVKESTWNPMVWNPGTAVHLLLSREFAPEQERLSSARARAMSIPGFLVAARETLGNMPAIHVETAITQLKGTLRLVQSLDLPPDPTLAIEQHIEWLEQRLAESTRSPRRGADMYAGILWHTLDHTADINQLLETAHAHLDVVTQSMTQVATEYLELAGIDQNQKIIRTALDHIASVSEVTNDTVLGLVESAVASTREFVIKHDLVSIPHIDTDVIEMPEIYRGVAVAYCDSPGPLEKAHIPTFVAVAPTPSDWSEELQASFYREYNAVQIHDLTIHEAFPGHVLQLALSSRGEHQSLIRRCGMSGVFVEGWAVYAEEFMVEAGYSPEPSRLSHLAIRLQQLKMQTRMTINTILDISVHSRDMSEEEAMVMMIERGFQEEGEASGKWRRALLTAGQLPTYFVGYFAVKELAHDLRVLHPDWTHREIHDLMLSYGSPAPRHVRELVGV